MINQMNRGSINKILLSKIIEAAPAKLLWETTKFYFINNQPSQVLLPVSSEDSVVKQIKLPQNDAKILSFDELLAGDQPSISTQDENLEVTTDGIAMKAVKADNAEAEDSLWNKLLFTRCLNIDYIHKVHAPILNWSVKILS